MASYPESTGELSELFNKADFPLVYEAKPAGGNQVSQAHQEDRPPGTLAAPTGNIQKRLDAVDLRISIQQALPQNYIIDIKNESNEHIRVTKIRLEKQGIQLTESARPKAIDEWILPPRSAKCPMHPRSLCT